MKIADHQSPAMLNMEADGRGGLTKRGGQALVYATSLGATAINGITYYKNKKIVAWGTGLYTQELSNQPVSIKTGLTNAKGVFFNFNSKLYYMNGHEFIVYDGTTVSNVVDDCYVPLVGQSLKPDGSQGGTVTPINEDINLLCPYFYKTYIGDGSSTEYNLNLTNLDDVTEVKVNDVVQDPSYYTKDLTAGKVTFVAGHIPPANTIDPDNVKFKIKKANSSRVAQILGCTQAIEYEQKMFLCGNPSYKNKYYVMGITDRQDATYWPELGYNNTIGGSDEYITGFAEFYNKLIIFREHTIHALTFTTNTAGTTMSSVKKISGTIGCDMPGSIQVVNNNPIFANTYGGIHLIISTIIESEKNVVAISDLINTGVQQGLLDEAIEDLKACSSTDYNSKYRLCVGSKEYIWDYSLQAYGGNPDALHWFLNDNVNAMQYLIIGQDLFYGRRSTGELVAFIEAHNDFGQPINAYYTSKLLDFGVIRKLKNIRRVYYATRPGTASTITVTYTDDEGDDLGTTTTMTSTGGWDIFQFDTFTWAVSRYSKPLKLKANLRNTEYFQIKFSNNNYNENLSLLDLQIEYALTKSI